jgi:phosphoinositide-3-kinase regulatory subunit 4
LEIDSISTGWLMTGTMRGVVSLWDMRFQVPISSWQHYTQAPIRKLRTVPKNSRIVYCAAGDNQVSSWDIERSECCDVFSAQAESEVLQAPSDAIKVDLPYVIGYY